MCCLLLCWARLAYASGGRTDSLLQVLDRTLDQQAHYDELRLARLAALQTALHTSHAPGPARFDVLLRICNEYQFFKYDSSFAYSVRLGRLARQLHDPARLQTARTKLAYTLRSAGMFKDAFDTLRTISVRQLPPRYQQEFYEIFSVVNIELAEYDRDGYYQPFYTARANAYADTAARYGAPNSYSVLAQRMFRVKQQNSLAAGLAVYQQLLKLPLTTHQLAINSSGLAKLYEAVGQREPALYYMTLAAINDIRSSTKEGIALFNVSAYCYQHGDLARAYRYINEAKKTAAFYKARQRMVQISPIASLIDGQKITVIEIQRRQARQSAIAIGVLAALLLVGAFVIFAQLRRLQRTGRQLAATNHELQANNTRQQQLNGQLQALNLGLNEANRIKEEYIGYYFSSASRYIDKLESLQKKLGTQLATKHLAAAQQLISDINIKAERTDLFTGFDTVFVQLFPTFVAEFNALFPEPELVYPPEGQLLTTEQRIFALIRLGITDSEQISRILGYSIHTVYAYKTRVKNRSFLPNEEFEGHVLAIGAVGEAVQLVAQ